MISRPSEAAARGQTSNSKLQTPNAKRSDCARAASFGVWRLAFGVWRLALRRSRGIALPFVIGSASASAAPVDFAKDIYPVLRKNCLACHNTTKSKANLNLESPQTMLKGGDGGPAIVPGKSAESLLYKASAHLDEDTAMPPRGNKVDAVALTPDQLAALKSWIDEGAKGEAVADAKGPLPWRAQAASGPVNALAFSPDARLVAGARGDRVALCDVATGRVLARLADPVLENGAADRDAVMSVAFGADDLLATGGFRTVRIWRRMPRVVARDFGALAEVATAIAISADGQWAAAGDAKGAVWLWSMAAEKFEPVALKDHATPVTALAFSPNATALISTAEDKTVRVWSLADRSVAFKMDAPATIRSIAFLKGGTEIATGGADGTVRVWPWIPDAPAEAPKPLREFKFQDAPLVAMAVGTDGALWWCGADGALHGTNATDGKEVRKVAREHPIARRVIAAERDVQTAQMLAAARKAQLAAAAERAKKEADTARAAGPALEKARSEFQRKKDESRAAAETAQSKPDDKAAQDAAKAANAVADKAEAALRAAKVNAELGSRMAGESAGANAAAEIASIVADAALAEAQATLEAARKQAAEPPAIAVQIGIAPDSATALIVGADGIVSHIGLENGALLEPPDRAGVATYLPDGALLCIGADKHVRRTSARRVWALERTIGTPDDPAIFADRVTTLAFSPDGKQLATGGGTPSRDGELKLWRVADGTLARAIPKTHADTINSVAFSPDGEFLATAAGDRFARIWRVSDGSRVANLEGHTGHVLGVAWRADGLALATAGADRSLRVWDFAQAKQTANTADFVAEVSAVSFVGGSDALLAAGGDSSLRLGGKPLPDSTGFLFTAAADPTGRWVAAGGQDGLVRVWSVAERKVARTFAAE